MLPTAIDEFAVFGSYFANDFAWRTHHQRVWGDRFSFRNEGSCRDDRTGSDDNTVEQSGSDSDQAFIFHGGAVDDRGMPHGGSLSYRARKTGIRVQAAEILDVGLIPDADRFRISSQYRTEENAGFVPDINLAAYKCVLGNEGIGGDPFGMKCRF